MIKRQYSDGNFLVKIDVVLYTPLRIDSITIYDMASWHRPRSQYGTNRIGDNISGVEDAFGMDIVISAAIKHTPRSSED